MRTIYFKKGQNLLPLMIPQILSFSSLNLADISFELCAQLQVVDTSKAYGKIWILVHLNKLSSHGCISFLSDSLIIVAVNGHYPSLRSVMDVSSSESWVLAPTYFLLRINWFLSFTFVIKKNWLYPPR